MNLQLTKKFSFSFFLLLLIAVGGFGQARPVTGQVTDIEGKPVAGVTVIVKGTAGNVITDKEGRFRVMATPDQTISFSHIAYNVKEVKVGDHPTVDVALSKADSQLDDVIVIGYGSQRQKNITGSVVSVNMSRLTDQPVVTIAEALKGQVPGLHIAGGSVRPGEVPKFDVRQQFNWGKDGGNTNPLIVIDDVIQVDPQTGLSSVDRFNQLDLSEVESITVLRDAAAAIYGSRASQGAIVIKTKRGKVGAPKINYAGKFETNNAVSHGKTMNAYEYGVFSNRIGRISNWTKDQMYSDAELERMKSMNYDWLGNAWKAANALQQSVTVSGGAERATYFVGGSYYKQDANMGTNDYKKYTFRAGTDVTVANGLKLTASLNANNTNLNKTFNKINLNDGGYGVGGEQLDYSMLLHMPKYIPWSTNINGIDYFVSPALNSKNISNPVGTGGVPNTNYFGLLKNGSTTNLGTFNYSANLGVTYEIPFIKGLSVKGNYAIQSFSNKTEQVMNALTLVQNSQSNQVNRHLYDSAVWSAPIVNNKNSRVSYDNQTGSTEQINFFVNYDHSFGDHNISAVFSGERAKNTWDQRTLFYDFPIPGFYNGTSVTAGTFNNDLSISKRQENGTLSYLGRISYAFKSRYLLQFLFRADASSRFAPENYWGKFPSVSAGWVISDEDFFKEHVDFVNFLKIRVNVGKTGNDNVKPWKWKQTYNIESAKGMAFGGSGNGGNYTIGITPDVAPNRDIKWDQNIQKNIGLDFSVLRNRLSVNVDQYFNTYSDVLTAMGGAVGVPLSVGGGFAEQNFSGIKSWGTEISATWKDRIANKIDYIVSMNFGYGNYKTTKYFEQPFDYPNVMQNRTEQGNYGNIGVWGYRTWKETSTGDGILRTDEDIANYWAYLTDLANKSGVPGAAPKYGSVSDISGLKKGMVAYEDVRGSRNTADRTYAGPNGQIIKDEDQVLIKKNGTKYGITTNLSFAYKGISLSAQIATSWGGYNTIDWVKNALSSSAMLWSQPVIVNDMYDDSLNVNGKYPNIAYTDAYFGTNSDAKFWKIPSFRMYVRTLSVGYSLPKMLVKRARLDNARVYLAGNNLWDFYNPYPNKYRNMYDNPTVLYPTLRTWALGVNLGF